MASRAPRVRMVRVFDEIVGSRLTVADFSNASAFKITSSDDPLFASGGSITGVFRDEADSARPHRERRRNDERASVLPENECADPTGQEIHDHLRKGSHRTGDADVRSGFDPQSVGSRQPSGVPPDRPREGRVPVGVSRDDELGDVPGCSGLHDCRCNVESSGAERHGHTSCELEQKRVRQGGPDGSAGVRDRFLGPAHARNLPGLCRPNRLLVRCTRRRRLDLATRRR